jgi:hypothetical protein
MRLSVCLAACASLAACVPPAATNHSNGTVAAAGGAASKPADPGAARLYAGEGNPVPFAYLLLYAASQQQSHKGLAKPVAQALEP